MAYADYLKSEQWKIVSSERRRIDGYKCVCCGCSENLNVHHIYYPAVLENTQTDMLRTLCRECHLTVHRIQETHDKMKNIIKLTKYGYIDRTKSPTAYEILARNIMRIFIVQCWKRNIFQLEDVTQYVRGIESIASGIDGNRISKFHTNIGNLMGWIALVKDCYISNKNPDFNTQKRAEHRLRKTRFK